MVNFYCRSFSFLLGVLALLGAIPDPVRSQSVLEDIQKTGLLRVGIREDAVPFGYRDASGELSGLCLDFFEVLLGEVKAALNREAILVKLFQSTLYDRYELVSNRTVHLECGPNTIRPQENYQIVFSRPFFITGTQFLIAAEGENQFQLDGNLEEMEIGVLRNSANQLLLERRYPKAKFREFQGPTGRLRGVQALRQGRIDAFASDGILLIGESVLQGLAFGRQYQIVPAIPLDCVLYGMALPEGDGQWLALVNAAIVRAREKQIFKGWFEVVLPEIRDLASRCLDRNRNDKGENETLAPKITPSELRMGKIQVVSLATNPWVQFGTEGHLDRMRVSDIAYSDIAYFTSTSEGF